MSGIVVVFTLTLYPYVLMPTLAGFKAIDVSIEEAARNLGGSRLHVFRTVLLPVVMPAVLAGALLVFIEALENFGVPAVLAEDRPFLAVDIFKLFAGESDANPACGRCAQRAADRLHGGRAAAFSGAIWQGGASRPMPALPRR